MMLDHSRTKVVLIGNSIYPDWPKGDIKNIDVNLTELKNVLCDPEFIGIKDNEESILVLPNMSKTKIQVGLNRMIKKCTAEDTLIVYYAGHGLLDEYEHKKLYMATADTIMDDKISTCVNSDDFRTSLMRCKALKKIMILDCCYAGRLAGMQGDAESLRRGHWGSTEGVYFLMSSDLETPSRFDPHNDKIPTFFTQKMVDTIKQGADKGSDIWTLDEFFDSMQLNWDLEKAPKPLSLTFSNIGEFPFCYNHYRRVKFVNNAEETEQKRYAEIESDPTVEKLKEFIDNCDSQELKLKALQLWDKLIDDWKSLKEALDKNDRKALAKFIKENNPVKPVLKRATQEMLSLSTEASTSSINQSVRSTTPRSKARIERTGNSSKPKLK